jgi:hypothetical protein
MSKVIAEMTPQEKRKSLATAGKRHNGKTNAKNTPVNVEDVVDLDIALTLSKNIIGKELGLLGLPLIYEVSDETKQPFELATAEMFANGDTYHTELQIHASVMDRLVSQQIESSLTGLFQQQVAELSATSATAAELLQQTYTEDMVTKMTSAITERVMETIVREQDDIFTTEVKLNEEDSTTLLQPLDVALHQCLESVKDGCSALYESNREIAAVSLQQLDKLNRKVTDLVEASQEDTADQIAKHDALEKDRLDFMKAKYNQIENQLQLLHAIDTKVEKLNRASDALTFAEETHSDEDEDAAADRLAREMEIRAADHTLDDDSQSSKTNKSSDYSRLSEEQIEDALDKCGKKKTRCQNELRKQVHESWKSEAGRYEKEKSASKDDLKELNKLKLGAINKDSRKKSNSRRMFECLGDTLLKKAEAYPAAAPMLFAYMHTNVSLSKFMLCTVNRLNDPAYLNGKEFDNPWGMGYLTIARFGDEMMSLYELLVKACGTSVTATTQPDYDFELTSRNLKITLKGVKDDANTYIEAWHTQQTYLSPRNMEMMRM